MITNNLINRMKEIFVVQPTPFAADDYTGLTVKNLAGTTYYLCGHNNGFPYSANRALGLNATTGVNIIFGKGVTEPSKEDYKLTNQITSGLTLVGTIGKQVSYEEADDGRIIPTLILTIALQNTSSSSITISEIGYTATFGVKASKTATSASTTPVFLLDHTLLKEPVTLDAGQFGTITYTLKSDLTIE